MSDEPDLERNQTGLALSSDISPFQTNGIVTRAIFLNDWSAGMPLFTSDEQNPD